MTFTLDAIEALVGGKRLGDEKPMITGVSDIENADSGDLVFAENRRFLERALRSRASVILISTGLASEAVSTSKPMILVDDARAAFIRVLEALTPAMEREEGVHSTSVLEEGVSLGTGASVGAQVFIGRGTVVGERVTVFPGVRIGADCCIGDDTVIHANAVLYAGVTVGRRCILHSGCVLGADGFGYVPAGRGLRKVPHLGGVEIGDEVEIGANSCIDRAKTGKTVVGSGTKIDNLVHIAHNVKIGMACLIIAQVGVAGSVEIGHGVVLAGQAGIADHLHIGDGARVAAQGGVIGDVKAGETVSGYPARPHRAKMREHAASALLPEYIKRVRDLEKRLAALEDSASVSTQAN